MTMFVLVNGVSAPSPTQTHSRITRVVLVFPMPVEGLLPGAVSLSGAGRTLTNLPDGGLLAGVSGNTVTLAFDPGVSGIDFGSLSDGSWTLMTDLGKVKTVGGSPVGVGVVTTPHVRRLFGDSNGDGTVDGADFAAFGAAFGLSFDPLDPFNGFDPAFDSNGDGTVDATDFGDFGARFGVSL